MEPSVAAEHFIAMRALTAAVMPPSWHALSEALDGLLATHPPFALLPLYCAAAAGAPAALARPVGAAGAALSLAYRTLDDAADGDRPNRLLARLGPGRAVNAATGSVFASMLLLADPAWPADRARRAVALVAGCGLRAALGQDRDLGQWAQSIADHCWIAQEKNGRIYGALCGAGAAVATDDSTLIEGCFRFGMHLGVVLQVADDLEGVVASTGNDARRGHVTLPLAMLVESQRNGADGPVERLSPWTSSGLEAALRAEGVTARLLAHARHHHHLATQALHHADAAGRVDLVDFADAVLAHLERWCAAPARSG